MSVKTINPVGKRREKQKIETYALILESARFLFETKGFEKTTIRAVASHAEIALGTIYKHFRDYQATSANLINSSGLKRRLPYKAVQIWEYCSVLFCKHLIFRYVRSKDMIYNLLKLLTRTAL